jgi:ABC-type transport system substrate-binding protein
MNVRISYPSVLDPDFYLYSRFHSSVAGMAGNVGAFADAEVDRLLDLGRAATNRAERGRLMATAAERIDQLAANIFLWYNPLTSVSSLRVSECVASGTNSDFVAVDLAREGAVP